MADEPVQFASLTALPNYPSIPCIIKTEKKSDRKSLGKEILEKVSERREENRREENVKRSVPLSLRFTFTFYFPISTSTCVLWGKFCKRLTSFVALTNCVPPWECLSTFRLYYIILYGTMLYCTALSSTILQCTLLRCTVLWCTILYCVVMYCTSSLSLLLQRLPFHYIT